MDIRLNGAQSTMKEEKRRHLLLVDDVPVNIKILAQAFKNDYRLSFATNGEDALKQASADPPPDLVLLDIIIPKMDGYEVCQRLKENPKTRHIPVIFLTAKSLEEDEARGLDLGAVDYITKPISLPIVRARVKTHLELKQHRELLENLSTLDGLTGIPNRRYFDDFLNMEWRRAMRSKNKISLVMIDIDYFKNFNDNYGHTRGDDALKQVAKTLASSFRRSADFVARYGGEEFVVVLPETEEEAAAFVADIMRKKVAALDIEHKFSEIGDRLTISMGVASVVPELNSDPASLINAADKALYKAKERGRNQVVSTSLET